MRTATDSSLGDSFCQQSLNLERAGHRRERSYDEQAVDPRQSQRTQRKHRFRSLFHRHDTPVPASRTNLVVVVFNGQDNPNYNSLPHTRMARHHTLGLLDTESETCTMYDMKLELGSQDARPLRLKPRRLPSRGVDLNRHDIILPCAQLDSTQEGMLINHIKATRMHEFRDHQQWVRAMLRFCVDSHLGLSEEQFRKLRLALCRKGYIADQRLEIDIRIFQGDRLSSERFHYAIGFIKIDGDYERFYDFGEDSETWDGQIVRIHPDGNIERLQRVGDYKFTPACSEPAWHDPVARADAVDIIDEIIGEHQGVVAERTRAGGDECEDNVEDDSDRTLLMSFNTSYEFVKSVLEQCRLQGIISDSQYGDSVAALDSYEFRRH
ncbi:hypothetical protein QBC46DRAFT_355657 [Diplogelasinospora grovesii]|uniref:Uncharacterized protein n=1 Tax=Diplogelasinospora grovesii TaxID=303347 RepID=A0AAN6N5C2_9PEZI|nr:hypothetical protein QBC46DRAFT_355657 [Diplogelasinospora grovesii]